MTAAFQRIYPGVRGLGQQDQSQPSIWDMLGAGAIASGITTAEQIALQQTNPLYQKQYYQQGPPLFEPTR